jgi:hypothetical protein
MPLRALATVTIGFCAMHDHGAATLDSGHGHSDDHDGAPHGDGNHAPCNSCVEHCASASVVASEPFSLAADTGSDRIVLHERVAAGFVPDQLDPPPLVL